MPQTPLFMRGMSYMYILSHKKVPFQKIPPPPRETATRRAVNRYSFKALQYTRRTFSNFDNFNRINLVVIFS
jgi:hypothetical protein